MDNVIWFKYTNFSELKIDDINSNNLNISRIDIQNYSFYLDKIQISIDKFNSEIVWDKMWNISDAKQRFFKNNILYLLTKLNLPIGHVWYDKEYLYNAFVSNEREYGVSKWFIQNTMYDRYQSGFNSIFLYSEIYNQRAINFWKKLGFYKIEKNYLD